MSAAKASPAGLNLSKCREERGKDMQNGFDIWYNNYPRKEAKLAAKRAYDKAIKNGASHETLVEGLARFNAHLESQPREKKFIPLPAS